MRLGATELIVILIIVLLIFGPKQLPKLGKVVGSAFKSTKKQVAKASKEWEENMEDDDDDEEKPAKKKSSKSSKKKKKDA